MKTPGAAGVKTSICRIQVYVDIAVQPGGFNGSLIFWFHMQEPLIILTHTDVTNNHHALNQDTKEHEIKTLPKNTSLIFACSTI